MNLTAIQHNAFDNYCYPLNEDEMQVNIRTGKDVDRIQIVAGDPFKGGIMGANHAWKGETYEITCFKELETSLWWSFKYKPQFKRLAYYFIIYSGDEKIGFSETGFHPYEEIKDGIRFGFFIFPWMNTADVITPPEWVQNTVWYQIFPSRFARGENPLDTRDILPWGRPDQEVTNKDVFGGNLQGMIDRLPYLAELGITGVYTTPINSACSEHKYDTTDYYTIDPSFGTNETFREFVKKAHENNIRVMVDGVFNHSGWFFKPWQDVLEKREKSEYASWFMINDFNFSENEHNTAKGRYYSFAFVDFMPKLNTSNPKVINYILDVCRYWVKEYDIDGLRLDVANEISHKFCKALNQEMKSLKPDFFIVGEIWHNSLPWLREHEFDSIMNYPVQHAVADFFKNTSSDTRTLEYSLNRCLTMYYEQSNRVMFNQMDSHDTIRITTLLKSPDKAIQSIVFLFILPGSVCLYYGTELLLEGAHDPDCRRCMPWNEIKAGNYDEYLKFFRTLIELRKSNPAFTSVNLEFIHEKDSRILHVVKDKKFHLYANASSVPFNIQKGKVLISNRFEAGILEPDGVAVITY